MFLGVYLMTSERQNDLSYRTKSSQSTLLVPFRCRIVLLLDCDCCCCCCCCAHDWRFPSSPSLFLGAIERRHLLPQRPRTPPASSTFYTEGL